jgi:hypothetical protein
VNHAESGPGSKKNTHKKEKCEEISSAGCSLSRTGGCSCSFDVMKAKGYHRYIASFESIRISFFPTRKMLPLLVMPDPGWKNIRIRDWG